MLDIISFFTKELTSLLNVYRKEEVEGQERWTPLTGEGGVPVLLDVKQLPPLFWEAVGKNTSYIHHPEETIAGMSQMLW